jgi:hypothetical protein
MNQSLIILSLALILSGCAKGASDSPVTTGVTPVAPVACKSIESVWQSTVDLERHDFTGMRQGVTVRDYEYRAADGLACGYAANPVHFVDAILVRAGETGLTDKFSYRLDMTYSLAIGASCGTYSAIPMDTHQSAYIVETGCNEIKICNRYDINGVSGCKTFR